VESKITKLGKNSNSKKSNNNASDAKSSLSSKTFQQLKQHDKSDVANRTTSAKKEKARMSLYKQQQEEQKVLQQQLQIQQLKMPLDVMNNRVAYINVPVTRRKSQALRTSDKESSKPKQSSSK
jgi:hypothetical protein